MAEFIKVGSTSDIPDPGTMVLELEDRILVLVHVDGQYYCLDDVCTHDGGPLADGTLEGCELICPRHGARFDVRNGQALTMPATEATSVHEVKVDGDDLFVRINED
jgi:3-phenylpropionate/trans-cinnamate dioxygenase ferredoxin subunit